jgi:hypothetical protein
VPYEWDDWAMQTLAGIEPYEVLQIISARHRWPRRGTTPDGLAALTIWAELKPDDRSSLRCTISLASPGRSSALAR